jgi:Ni/Fe-hydrogenase subunit HybB-like protein
LPWTRTVNGISLASVLVVVGMWLKRWIIVVPPLEYGVTSGGLGSYTPTWIEWTITAAGLAGLALTFLIFQRLFPIISIWEMEHEAEEAAPRPVVEQPVVVGALKGD